MEDVMTTISAAGVTIAGYVATAAGAAVTLAIVGYGARYAWRTFKSLR